MTHVFKKILMFSLICVMAAGSFAVPADAAESPSPIEHTQKSIQTSSGAISMNILSVDVSDPRVAVKTSLVNNKIGATAPFSQIVESSGGAVAVINGNFFASYSDFKAPIGHLMSDGVFLYGNSGISSLGITNDREIRVGRPPLFTRIKESGSGKSWAAYEINCKAQGEYLSVMYTPAYGPSVPITVSGKVMIVSDGKITAYSPVAAGSSVEIPADGFVMYMGDKFTSTNYFKKPTIGKSVSTEYFLQKPDQEGFTLSKLNCVVSGAPRLVQDSKIVTTLEPGFTDARFTVNAAPRTAVGVGADGHLILVSTPGATIQQMREAMLSLGCKDAINLDGGASSAMYYDGQYIATPGRELTVTLQVFVEDPNAEHS